MNAADSSCKYYRILEMYLRLLDGEKITKKEEAERYGVDVRSIQRDLDALRVFLSGQQQGGFSQSVIYDWKTRGYVLQGNRKDLTREEALALCKILLESRAFTKKQMESVVDKIIRSAVPRPDIEPVQQLVNNEKRYYEELQHHDGELLEKIWGIGDAISRRCTLVIRYERRDGVEVERTVKPLSIMFSEFYFYLIAEMADPEEAGLSRDRYRFPTVYRLDRVRSFEEGAPFKVDYSRRFQSGEVRKRILYMFGGQLEHVVFEYIASDSVAHVLDRLPTAKIEKKELLDNGRTKYTISAEVYGLGGIRLWIRSQGPQIRVLAPEQLVKETKEELQAALALYRGIGRHNREKKTVKAVFFYAFGSADRAEFSVLFPFFLCMHCVRTAAAGLILQF